MATIIESIDNIVAGLVQSESFPEYGSLIFFLLFFVIFSVTFASTAFIPIFKGEDKMNNIRAVISLSIAFLSTIFYFDLLIGSMLFFGVWLILSFFSSFAIIAVIPKEVRNDAAKSPVKKIVSFCVVICLLITMVIFFGYFDEMLKFLDPIVGFFAKF